MKAAAYLWNFSTLEHRCEWYAHPNHLNQRSLPGCFKTFRDEMFVDWIIDNFMISLQSDWLFAVKKMETFTTQHSQRVLATMSYNIGKEINALNSQSYG